MSGDAEFPLTLEDLGEREILTQVLRPRYRDTVGFGDDCAVLSQPPGDELGGELVATTDSCPTPLVTILGERDLFYTGWLLAAINLSDLAAAGALPLGLVVNYTLPKQTTVDDFRRLLDGVDACAAAHGTQVVGGDLRDGQTMQLSATAVGRCVPGRRLGRTGATLGDRLLLVGSPGYLWASALLSGGKAKLSEQDTQKIRSRARQPMAQVAAGRVLAESGLARAAMDVSDGLYATVRTLCEANGLGARMNTDIHLDSAIAEVCAQSGLSQFELAETWGDWSLVVVVRAEDVEAATTRLSAEAIPAREIGTLADAGEGLSLTVGGTSIPWRGIAQERFSTSSWHGGELSQLMADVLRVPAG
jgi:thiamine-monophosphate kinase